MLRCETLVLLKILEQKLYIAIYISKTCCYNCMTHFLTRYYMARRPVICVADPELLEQIFVKEFSNFHNRPVCIFHLLALYNLSITKDSYIPETILTENVSGAVPFLNEEDTRSSPGLQHEQFSKLYKSNFKVREDGKVATCKAMKKQMELSLDNRRNTFKADKDNDCFDVQRIYLKMP